MGPAAPPIYLHPYYEARRHRAQGLNALLWAGPESQRRRFEAIARNCPLDGASVLDVGCGEADLLGFLLDQGISPSRYVGIDDVPESVEIARSKGYLRCEILRGDFVREPAILRQGTEVVVFSGSLNTLSSRQFYRTLRASWASGARWLVFNFLSSPSWAGAEFLHWHRPESVLALARSLSTDPKLVDGYIEGDSTVVMRR